MGFIRNYDTLAQSEERKIVLDLIEADSVMKRNFVLEGDSLRINKQEFILSSYTKIILVGFGKGAAHVSKIIESRLADKLTEGYCIDVTPETFSKIEFTLGTHPLPSEANYTFTQNVIKKLSSLDEKTLVLVVICGGGSAMLVSPVEGVNLEQKIAVNKALLQSGANIIEMNTVRKHLSRVKGGGLAKLLYPATVASLIFSDVPGNDLSFIASGPTVKDTTTANDAIELIVKYNLVEKIEVKKNFFTETPKDDMYFKNVSNILMLSNLTALHAMEEKAKQYSYNIKIYSNTIQGDAHEVGKLLLDNTPPHTILLAAGETTVKVKGSGRGGRNQEVVLGNLNKLDDTTVLCSFDSDGWDFDTLGGAIGDHLTRKKAYTKGINIQKYLDNNDSLTFFQAVEDGIDTGRLPSNVADIMIVLKQ